MNYSERIKVLYIDVENLKSSVVIINGVNTNSPTRKEEMFSISKSVSVYGIEEHVKNMVATYEPTKIVYCEL